MPFHKFLLLLFLLLDQRGAQRHTDAHTLMLIHTTQDTFANIDLVLLAGGKSCKTILENVSSQWVIRGDIHVDSHVELAVIDQKRLSEVPARILK